ncbi:MAG: alpha-galactosidase [Lachnospiraceae bacterium]
MGIRFDEEKKIFKLDTKNTSYIIGLTVEGYVGHIYYGKRISRMPRRELLRIHERPFTPSVLEREKGMFLDNFLAEYPTGGVGDYRESCLEVQTEENYTGCEIFYRSHIIERGKKKLLGLPASFGKEDEVETLTIICEDPILNMEVRLSYSVFYEKDIITRNVKILNQSEKRLKLRKAYSACIDMDNKKFEMLSLVGAWARERHIQRGEIRFGKQMVSSNKGISSHHEHPFLALVTPETTEDVGEVYGMHFVYSGSFLAQAELTCNDQVRMTMGIHPDHFGWNLKSGEEFQTPEVVLVYSSEGIGKMTRNLHDFYRNHMIRSSYQYKKRPILINNWEATYFEFDTEKLLDIAREAKKQGIEMLVMDDGWFGKRDNDDSSLGDWIVNEEKIVGGLPALVSKVNEIGLEFGIWFEPEMISLNSNLYRAHPDWALQLNGRIPTQSRAQYVLDLSREEIRDYVYESVAKILRSANITYVKWDMNRPICDIGSSFLDREAQDELLHRYMLGVYELQERLVEEFPNLLLENCCSGGGRFDPGMLYYSPQIWCSDDTDAIERLKIQEGTALLYPLSTIGAHVSDCPNHTAYRVTPFKTRGDVALCGTFGYELDITKISEEDRAQIPSQTALYNKYYKLIQKGDYYRISSWSEQEPIDCWEIVSKDKKEALITYVQVLARVNKKSSKIYLKGLDPEKEYIWEETGEIYGGDELMNCGFLVKNLNGDFISKIYHFIEKASA